MMLILNRLKKEFGSSLALNRLRVKALPKAWPKIFFKSEFFPF